MPTASDWLAAQRAQDERRFLNLVAGSFVVHALLVGLLAFAPKRASVRIPPVLRVNLVSLPSQSSSEPKASPQAATRPRPKQVVLPKQAPKAVPRRRAEPPPTRRVRPEPLAYEDALAALRKDLGEVAPPIAPTAPDTTTGPAGEGADAPISPLAGAHGLAADPALMAWKTSILRHLRNCWKNPPEFLNRGLATGITATLTSTGEVIGPPRIKRTSGDPYFDDNAVRAVVTCAPLPAPPASGDWDFFFNAETR